MWISALISDATMTSSLNALNFSMTSVAKEKGKWEEWEWEGVEELVSTDRRTIKSKEMGGHSEMEEKRDRRMERVIQHSPWSRTTSPAQPSDTPWSPQTVRETGSYLRSHVHINRLDCTDVWSNERQSADRNLQTDSVWSTLWNRAGQLHFHFSA